MAELLGNIRGPKGFKGDTGNGIAGIERTAGDGSSGTTDTYTVTYTDGNADSFTVYNGEDGQGTGDMKKSVYDPSGKNEDVFAYADGAEARAKAASRPASWMPTAAEVGAAASNHTHTASQVGAAAAGHTHTAAQVGAAVCSAAAAALTPEGWSALAQTVSVSGVTADDNVIISPSPADIGNWAKCGVYASAQATGSITFSCTTVPTAALTAQIMIVRQEA